MRQIVLILLLCACLGGCRGRAEEGREVGDGGAPAAAVAAPLVLPDDDAGRVVARAIEASGGWESWQRHRDASFVSTLTIFDPVGNAVSETIFLHRILLHRGVMTRVDSIGLGDEVQFGFDGDAEWMLHGGRVVSESQRVAFTRFHALSSAYWFSLPFALAELPGELTYLGREERGGRTFERIRVGYDDSVPLPFDWLVLYFDAATGRIDRVHVHALAEFLQHSLWVGVWGEARPVGDLEIGRRYAFFAADPAGEIVGRLAGEQLVEHVEFDRGFGPELFRRPSGARGLTAEIES
jgi:hypothetical protein